MRFGVLVVALLPVLGVLSGCSEEKSALRQIRPDSVVYIDGWDDRTDWGDRALVEQKPSGLWVIPLDAPFRATRSKRFDVQVKLDPARGFVVTDLGATQVGKDHDDCLEIGETYAFVDVPAANLKWEPPRVTKDGPKNDDCEVVDYG